MLDLWILVVSWVYPIIVFTTMKILFNRQWRKVGGFPPIVRHARRYNNALNIALALTLLLTFISWYLLY